MCTCVLLSSELFKDTDYILPRSVSPVPNPEPSPQQLPRASLAFLSQPLPRRTQFQGQSCWPGSQKWSETISLKLLSGGHPLSLPAQHPAPSSQEGQPHCLWQDQAGPTSVPVVWVRLTSRTTQEMGPLSRRDPSESPLPGIVSGTGTGPTPNQ